MLKRKTARALFLLDAVLISLCAACDGGLWLALPAGIVGVILLLDVALAVLAASKDAFRRGGEP